MGHRCDEHVPSAPLFCESCAAAVADPEGYRRIRFGRWGLAEDPVGKMVTVHADRHLLLDVVGTYRNDVAGCVMLKTRHFNGEGGPDLAASAVRLIPRR